MTDEWTLEIVCTNNGAHDSRLITMAALDASGELSLYPGRDRRTGPTTWAAGHVVADHNVAYGLKCPVCPRHPKPSWDTLRAVAERMRDAGITRGDISHMERARIL